MKQITKYLIVAIAPLLFACSSPTLNKKENFDFGWKFYAGEIDGVESPDFDASSWREVDLPHDWSIEGNFSRENPSFSRGGWLPTGKVAYRKSFFIAEENRDKRMVIYFDGAYRNSEVFVNGHKLGARPMGYIAFYYDLTDHLSFGDENVITVKLDNSSQPGSRWYTGTGIYRNVQLITTGKLYVPVWGSYIVANDFDSEKAVLQIETSIRNDFEADKEVVLRHKAWSPSGNMVSEISKELSVSAGDEILAKVELEVPDPFLWSQLAPNLYTIETELLVGNSLVYSESNHTGIRKLEFSNTEGFKLNGETIKLKGVCLHHDGGPLGAAVHRRTIERQLEKLREMGCNAVRTAHNPFSEEFLDVCDSMGFLVMNEMFDEWELPKSPMTVQDGKKIRIPIDFYASVFIEWADRDMTDFVLRDRNHPSVIMWSIGNEIDQMRRDEGAPIGFRLADIVHQLDYRPVSNGVHGYGWGVWPSEEAIKSSDIRGYNYIKDEGFTKERLSNPEAMAIVTEHESAQSFYPRSTYLYDEQKKAWWDQLDYEGNDAYEWAEQRDIRGESGMDAWAWVKKRPYVMGLFIWTGWDYLGEVIPFGWPARSSSFGPIDLAGFPKDGYYFYQSQWTDEPMVHIFPHWNLAGMEGKTVRVYGFTNGDEVELFQDGLSLGKKTNNHDSVEYQSWDVVYKAGELKAVSYENGVITAEKVVRTAGAPAKIKLDTRRYEMKANGQDLIYLECTILDKDGNEVPTADNKIKFDVLGPATIAGVGNGDNMGLEPFNANERSAFNGKCLAILQSKKEAGSITCTVSSEGLESTIIELNSQF